MKSARDMLNFRRAYTVDQHLAVEQNTDVTITALEDFYKELERACLRVNPAYNYVSVMLMPDTRFTFYSEIREVVLLVEGIVVHETRKPK